MTCSGSALIWARLNLTAVDPQRTLTHAYENVVLEQFSKPMWLVKDKVKLPPLKCDVHHMFISV